MNPHPMALDFLARLTDPEKFIRRITSDRFYTKALLDEVWDYREDNDIFPDSTTTVTESIYPGWWKQLGNCNYEVSRGGQIRNKKTKRWLTLHKDKSGYLQTVIHQDGRKRNIRVHKAVAVAHLNHRPQYYKEVVHHINHVREDNRVCNLRLMDSSEHHELHYGKTKEF